MSSCSGERPQLSKGVKSSELFPQEEWSSLSEGIKRLRSELTGRFKREASRSCKNKEGKSPYRCNYAMLICLPETRYTQCRDGANDTHSSRIQNGSKLPILQSFDIYPSLRIALYHYYAKYIVSHT